MNRRGFLRSLFVAAAPVIERVAKWLPAPVAARVLGYRDYIGCTYFTKAVILNEDWMVQRLAIERQWREDCEYYDDGYEDYAGKIDGGRG